jgi:hypothetical protein
MLALDELGRAEDGVARLLKLRCKLGKEQNVIIYNQDYWHASLPGDYESAKTGLRRQIDVVQMARYYNTSPRTITSYKGKEETMAFRTVCFGLGPIVLGIARLSLSRPGLAVIGAIDIDPARQGHDLGELVGHAPTGVKVTSDAAETLSALRPEVVLHATGSSLLRVMPQIQTILDAGANVISTCEELAFPWATQPQLAADLDELARRMGLTVLGTGINPGYAMDALPLMLTAPCTAVRSIQVVRVVDASRRRGPLQRKVGAGLTPEALRRAWPMAASAMSACPSRCICWPPGLAGSLSARRI